jgi:hypothetical protein
MLCWFRHGPEQQVRPDEQGDEEQQAPTKVHDTTSYKRSNASGNTTR